MSSHSYFIQKTLTCRSRTRIPFWPTIIPRWRPAPPQGQEGQQRCDEDQGNSQTMESNFSTSRKSPAAGELGGIWICYDWKTDSLGSDLKRDFQVHATSGKVGKAVEGLLSNKGLNEGQVSVSSLDSRQSWATSLLRLAKQRQAEMEDSNSFLPMILDFEEECQWCSAV